jgi:hypothetical protein
MRKSVGTAVLAVLSVGGLLLGNGSAQAATGDISWVSTTDSAHGGSASYVSLGDDLYVCDNVSGDAYGAHAWLMDDAGDPLEDVYDGVPDNHCNNTNQNVLDGVKVRIYLCLYRNGGIGQYCTYSPWGVS